MKYLFYLLISLVIHSLCYVCIRRKKLVNLVDEDEKEKYQSSFVLMGLSVLAITFFFIEWRVFLDTKTIFDFLRMIILYAVIMISAWIDYKCKIIPNKILLIAVGLRLLLYIPEGIYMGTELLSELINEGLALLLSLLLIVFSLILKKGIGMGDIKLFAVIALYTGAFFTYSVLFVSVLAGAMIGVVMIVGFHRDKKTAIPFGPLILLGYMVAALLGSY